MIRNFSLTLGEQDNSTAKAVAGQKWPRDSLDKVVLDNGMALNYLLAKQGGICMIENTTCCTWINTSGEAEIQLHMIREQAHWSQQISPDTLWSFDLFIWLTSYKLDLYYF